MRVFVLQHMSDRTFGLDPVKVPPRSETYRYWTAELNSDSNGRGE